MNLKTDTFALEMLESYLPPHQRAWELCQCFIDHGSYFFRPLKRDELFDQVMATIYATAQGRHSNTAVAIPPYESPHTLAIFYFALALGVLSSHLVNRV
jgi:hypothetical protein